MKFENTIEIVGIDNSIFTNDIKPECCCNLCECDWETTAEEVAFAIDQTRCPVEPAKYPTKHQIDIIRAVKEWTSQPERVARTMFENVNKQHDGSRFDRVECIEWREVLRETAAADQRELAVYREYLEAESGGVSSFLDWYERNHLPVTLTHHAAAKVARELAKAAREAK